MVDRGSGKGRNDGLIRDTTPLRNQGCRKEPWERLIAALVPASSLSKSGGNRQLIIINLINRSAVSPGD